MEILPCISYKSPSKKHAGESGCHWPPLSCPAHNRGRNKGKGISWEGKVCEQAGKLALRTEGLDFYFNLGILQLRCSLVVPVGWSSLLQGL